MVDLESVYYPELAHVLGLDPDQFKKVGMVVKATPTKTTVEITFSRELSPSEATRIGPLLNNYYQERMT